MPVPIMRRTADREKNDQDLHKIVIVNTKCEFTLCLGSKEAVAEGR